MLHARPGRRHRRPGRRPVRRRGRRRHRARASCSAPTAGPSCSAAGSCCATPPPRVRRILRVTRLHRVLTLDAPVAARPSEPPGRLAGPKLPTGRLRAVRDQPWVMRTYAGHSSAAESNALYRRNLSQGPDRPLGRIRPAHPDRLRPRLGVSPGEVGKVGVPVSHVGDMRALLQGIPLDRMNTSMTINATAMWLLALYLTVAAEQGIDPPSAVSWPARPRTTSSRSTSRGAPTPSRRSRPCG